MENRKIVETIKNMGMAVAVLDICQEILERNKNYVIINSDKKF